MSLDARMAEQCRQKSTLPCPPDRNCKFKMLRADSIREKLRQAYAGGMLDGTPLQADRSFP